LILKQNKLEEEEKINQMKIQIKIVKIILKR